MTFSHIIYSLKSHNTHTCFWFTNTYLAKLSLFVLKLFTWNISGITMRCSLKSAECFPSIFFFFLCLSKVIADLGKGISEAAKYD